MREMLTKYNGGGVKLSLSKEVTASCKKGGREC